MKRQVSTRVDIVYGTTAAELAKVLEKIPGAAKMSVTKTKYYDQRDPGETYITFSWSEEL